MGVDATTGRCELRAVAVTIYVNLRPFWWENKVINVAHSVTVRSLPGHDSLVIVGELMHLTVCPLSDPGSIPSQNGVFQGVSFSG